MHRPIVYTSEQARDVDFLYGMQQAMVGLGQLAQSAFGTATVATGLACTPTSPASLTVNVAGGQIYALQPLEATAYGVLPIDTTDSIVKQGFLLQTANLSCPAPGTAGYSINYLIEAAYQDSDVTNLVLPYFNSANPSQPLSGQNNSGATQPTQRQGLLVLTVKAGAAATTGSQTTPAADTGYIPLYVVTVANGQTQITAPNIVQAPGAPLSQSLLPALQNGSTTYGIDTGTANAYAVNLSPPIPAYADGMGLRVKIANSNTSASTLNVNGLGAINIYGLAGSALQGGELPAGGTAKFVYRAAANQFVLLSCTGGALQVAPATQSNQAVQRGRVLQVAPVVNANSVAPPPANTTYTAQATFTAPCAGYVVAIGSLGIGGSFTAGATISTKTDINGTVGGSDTSTPPLVAEPATLSVASGATVTATFSATTNGTAPGASIQLHVVAFY